MEIGFLVTTEQNHGLPARLFAGGFSFQFLHQFSTGPSYGSSQFGEGPTPL
jgi:hypothetical protein